MSTSIPETPEQAIENQGPRSIGKLEAEELQTLKSLQQVMAQMVQRIGQLEVEKASIISGIGLREQRAQQVMTQASARFGVDPSQKWTVGPDGEVFITP